MNKCKLSNVEICNNMTKDFNSIFLLQEPYLYKNRIPGLPNGFCHFGLANTRAIIVAPIFMNLVMCHELSSPDFTVVLLEQDGKKLYLVSAYLDINKNIICQQLTKILDFSPHPSVATQKILLCIDDAKSLQAFSIESAK